MFKFGYCFLIISTLLVIPYIALVLYQAESTMFILVFIVTHSIILKVLLFQSIKIIDYEVELTESSKNKFRYLFSF